MGKREKSTPRKVTPKDGKPENALIRAFMDQAGLTEKATALILNRAISHPDNALDNVGQRLLREWETEITTTAAALLDGTEHTIEGTDEAVAVVLAAGFLTGVLY